MDNADNRMPPRELVRFGVKAYLVAVLVGVAVGLLTRPLLGERNSEALGLGVSIAIFFQATPGWRERPKLPYLLHGIFIIGLSFAVKYLLPL